jgi:outer membrane receptor protein involved in Fe transport
MTIITCAVGAPALAQHATTGSLAGVVVGPDGAPLAGATVRLISMQGVTSAATDDDGRFLLPHLTPAPYDVRIEHEGFRPAERNGVEVRLGQRSELSITMTPGAFTDTVEVTATVPVLDLRSTSVGLTVDDELMSRIPVGRRIADTFYLAPGASSSSGAGTTNPSISGASGLENQYVVDGVNLTNSRYGAFGVYSSEYGPLGNGVTTEFIEELQVRSAGAEAEAEQSTGGLVTAITRSGTNDVAGSAFAYLTPAALEGERRTLELADGAVNTVGESSSEIGLTVGGPLVRDRAFYFVAASRVADQTTFIAPDGFPLEALGEVDRDRSGVAYAGKLTVFAGSGHRLELSAFGDPTTGDTGPQSAAAMRYDSTSAFSALDFGGHNQGLLYQGVLSPDWLVEASFAHAASTFQETVSVDEWQVIDETVTPSTTVGGKGRYEGQNDGDSLQLRARSTQLWGLHELRFGFTAEDVSSETTRDITGPPLLLSDGQWTASGAMVTIQADPVYGQIYRVNRAELNRERSSSATNLGLFVQDRWTAADGLTLSAGLRYERQRLEGSSVGVTFDDNWAPRLGAVWDPSGEGRVKLYGSAGVFFAKIPNNVATTLLGTGGRVRRADYFDPGLSDPVPEGIEALGTTRHLTLAATEPAEVDPSAALTSTRELSLGADWTVAHDLTLGIHLLHRDMPRVLEDVNTAAMVLYYEGEDNVEYMVTNPRDGYPATVDGVGAFVDPLHRFDAVTLTASKRLANRWSLFASYRWSRLWGNYEGFYRGDNDQANPAITGIFDFPPDDPSYTEVGVPEYGFRGDIRYLAEGDLLPNDRTHQAKVYGSYLFDAGVGLGASLLVSSGRPLTPMAASPVYDRPGEIPEAPRGSGIVTEDGFTDRTPVEWGLDVHADYPLDLGQSRLVLQIDVFNLFDHQGVLTYDQDTEVVFGVDNPDFGRRTSYQSPRRIRLAVRYEF